MTAQGRVLARIGEMARCLAGGAPDDAGLVSDAALVWRDGRIRWAGAERDLPEEYRAWPREDAGGLLVVPGLVDCHTHLGFGGWRADEFALRCGGATYLEIAERGGGIASTVAQTRAMDVDALTVRCRGFLREMSSLGVTTVEAKSGYGLDRRTELRLLEVYASLDREGPVRVVPTYLGAHIVPPEYAGRREAYLAFLVDTMIPEVARTGLARFCDVFTERSAFTVEESRRVLLAAKAAGLGRKLHADQLSAGGGAELAAEVGAVSADHLERISARGILALQEAGVVAVSLPLATLYLGHQPMPARRLLDAGVPVAVATDFNPGSAPSYHLPLAMLLGCTLQGMTPAEALRGATIVAARALGLDHEVGSLDPGTSADFALVDAPSLSHWIYHFRTNACLRTVIRGVETWRAPAGD